MKHIYGWIKVIIISIIIAFLINNYIIINAMVPTASMDPTIEVGDRLFAFRLSYFLEAPERGDIVVFKSNHDDKLLVKRLIGLPGEVIEIIRGKLYINGNVFVHDYSEVPMTGDFGPYTVPENHYFMLGDNRSNSEDSRYWDDPYVDEDDILGRIFIKYYPSLDLF